MIKFGLILRWSFSSVPTESKCYLAKIIKLTQIYGWVRFLKLEHSKLKPKSSVSLSSKIWDYQGILKKKMNSGELSSLKNRVRVESVSDVKLKVKLRSASSARVNREEIKKQFVMSEIIFNDEGEGSAVNVHRINSKQSKSSINGYSQSKVLNENINDISEEITSFDQYFSQTEN